MPHAYPKRSESSRPSAVHSVGTWVLDALKKAAVALWRAA
jgi:hypothetical protein